MGIQLCVRTFNRTYLQRVKVCGLGMDGLCHTEIHGYKSSRTVILLSSRIQFLVDNRASDSP